MKRVLLTTILIALPHKAFTKECAAHFISESDRPPVEGSQEMREISKIANTAFRKTSEIAQKIDDATLGLASAILTTGLPVENMAPDQWNKFRVQGQLVYSDSFMGESPLRGSKMTFTDGSYIRTIVTSHAGEFSESFTDLVPSYKFRIFSQPNIERRYRHVRLVDLPLTLQIETPFCLVETKIYEIPLEPFRIVISEKTEDSSGF